MLTLNEAIIKANEYLSTVKVFPSIELTLQLDETIEFEYGWVFFYQSKEYMRTRDVFDSLAGNAPIIINKYDGSLQTTGTAHTIEKYIADYVAERKKRESI